MEYPASQNQNLFTTQIWPWELTGQIEFFFAYCNPGA